MTTSPLVGSVLITSPWEAWNSRQQTAARLYSLYDCSHCTHNVALKSVEDPDKVKTGCGSGSCLTGDDLFLLDRDGRGDGKAGKEDGQGKREETHCG